ncbi:MAG: RcnB family protein [Woeseiaceae bacterium]|nr:RcnB family protein [Woeseiaceae bacterium]
MIRTIVTTLVLLFGLQLQASAEIGVSVVFSDDEIKIIGAWYSEHGSNSHPGNGKHKNKGLPPGIAKNLQRGKPLPPGIAKRYLPDDLRHALPAPPKGYERIIVDGKLLLVEIATHVIHDILVDVILD